MNVPDTVSGLMAKRAGVPWEREGLTGAGVIPFALVDDDPDGEKEGKTKQKVVVLFHTKSAGKKVGFLVDFGGGLNAPDEHAIDAAVREFSEETAGVFDLTDDELARQPLGSNRAVQVSPLTTLAAQRMRPRLVESVQRYLEPATDPSTGQTMNVHAFISSCNDERPARADGSPSARRTVRIARGTEARARVATRSSSCGCPSSAQIG